MSNTITKNRDLYVYLCSYFLYNTARVLPHAVLTIILLNKGMSVGDIAIIQSFYMIAATIFEYPSGVLTDYWSEKKMYIVSLLLLATSYLLIMVNNTFILLCISWFIYGISNAVMSGSLESFFLRQYSNDEKKIKRFNISFNNSNLLSGLLGGGIGSFIYTYFNNGIYIVSIILITLSCIIIIFLFTDDQSINKKVEHLNIKQDFRLHNLKNQFRIVNTLEIKQNLFLLSIYQIIAQVFYQFWQVLFLLANIEKKSFGIFYVAFQIIALSSNYLFKSRDFKKHKVLLVFSIIIPLILAVVSVHNTYIFLSSIFLFLIPFYIYKSQLLIELQAVSPPQSISSIMSFSGTCSSVISTLTLWSIGFLDSLFSFPHILLILISIFTIFSLLILIFEYRIKDKV